EATALITVEREGIISSRVVTLEGSAPQIEIPLGQEHMPNAFVSVILLHGRSAPPTTHQDTGAPAFKVGYVNLRVDPGERHLAVEVLPNAGQYLPGEEVTVQLRLKNSDGDGVPGEIVFSAADAGVLNLIAYKLPDPFDAFYGPRSLHVSTSEARANLVRQRNYGQKEEDRGGGGGDADYLLRTDFRPNAHWAPAVQTDARGRAEVTFRLPESLTTFRLMAAALSHGNEFGASSTDIVVTQPLVMQPALPRFARIGDELEAGVLVTNTTGEDGEVVVSAETDGLQLDGARRKTVFLENGGTKEVRFRWGVPGVGENSVTFSARLGAETDALQTSIPVMLPTSREVSATFASTEGAATELLRLPGSRLSELDRFSVNVSSTALAGLEGAVDYLFKYPYGCLEQRTSRIRPLLLAEDLIDAFGIETVGGRRDDLIREWFDEIEEYWSGQGFTFWRGGRVPHVYLSAYVLLALAEAADAGYAMPEPLTSEFVQWMESRVRAKSNKPPFYNADAWTTSRAFILYVLARHGRVLRTEIDELASALAATQTYANAEAAAHLLRAVELSKEPALQRHRGPLLDLLERQIRVEQTLAYLDVPVDPEYGWIYPSSVRATAHGVIALSESGDDPERLQLVQRMIRYLIRSRQSGWWRSTQDNAVVVDALKTFYRRFEGEEPDFTAQVLMAGEEILSETFRGRSMGAVSRDIGLEKFAALESVPVEIAATGTGRLYYDLMIDTYSTEPQQALSSGLQVERRIQRIDDGGQAIGRAFVTGGRDVTLQAGEMVLVSLTVTSPSDRNYVVVDDALPAGLEALNTSFVTSDRVATQAAGSDRWWGSFNHTEIRDDRVLLFADYLTRGEHRYSYVARATTPGSFVHPPVQAELMYNPEVRGRNATGRLIVDVEG
ncbi:MAG: alpha-2-macroglobulin family protein, partial [Planctomycetota bacterium]